MPPKYTKEQKAAHQARLKKTKERPKTAKLEQQKVVVVSSKPSKGNVKGRGDYLGDLLGGLANKAGQWAGNQLQGGFRKLTGFGDYRSHGPKYNTLYKRQPSEASFQMGAMGVKFGGAAPRVQHREFVGPVLSTGSSFSSKQYRVQPGQMGVDSLFPWGSSVANCFQQYILHGMILEYVTTSSDYSASSALGSVMMSMEYDAETAGLTSQIAVDNNEYTTSSKPSESFYHPIECASRDSQVNIRFVNAKTPVVGPDTRLNDVGIFQLSTNGISAPAGTQIGELWCTYDIEFLKASLPDIHAGTTASFTFPTASGANGTCVPNLHNSLPASYTSSTSILQMPAGYSGSFMLVGVLSSSTANVADSIGIATIGSEITSIPLFNTYNGTPTTAVYSPVASTGNAKTLMALTFSTTALTSSATNQIKIVFSGNSAGNGQIFILPLDNRLISVLTAMEPTEAALQSRIQRLEALLSRPATPPPEEEMKESETSNEEEHGIDTPWKDITPVAESDLTQSVYLPRGVLAKMLETATAGKSSK